MDNGPYLASSLSLARIPLDGLQAFPAIAFPPVWMNQKKLLLSPRREVVRYILGGRVTATTKRGKRSSPFFLKKVSGVHYTALFFFPPIMVRLMQDKVR